MDGERHRGGEPCERLQPVPGDQRQQHPPTQPHLCAAAAYTRNSLTSWGTCTDLGKGCPRVSGIRLSSYLPLAILLDAPDDSAEDFCRKR